MNYDTFINQWLGKSIDWDGYYGAQCVDMVAQYCAQNGKPVAYANAKDWWQHPALTDAFDFIANDPNNANQLPNRGEIIIWNGNVPGSQGFGHIAIWDMVTPSGFQSLDQNWGGQYVHFIPNHNWNWVIGWMRLKTPPAPEPQPIPAPQPAPDPVEPPHPVPEPVPVPEPTPEPAPVPEPTAHDKEQDKQINALQKMVQTIWNYLLRYKLFQKFIKKG